MARRCAFMSAGRRSTITGTSATFAPSCNWMFCAAFWKQQGHKIKQVMNITDVDDKIIRNAAAAHMPIEEYTAKYERAFFEDLDALGCERRRSWRGPPKISLRWST